MRRVLIALSLASVLACAGVTETNVAPAPCMTDEECGPSHRCVPLEDHDAATTEGPVPMFCRPR